MSSGGTKTATVSDASGTSASQTTVFDSETIRGRIGYAADNILFYATGGLAWSNDQFVRTQLTGTLNNATAGSDEAVNIGLVGWTIGGGIAYAFAQDWNVFAEYRYENFGTSRISLPLSQLTTTATISLSSVAFGVNYKFTPGWQPATAAPVPYPAPSSPLAYKSPPVQGTHDWTGIYLGADGGYGWSTSKGSLTEATGALLTQFSYGIKGPFAGLLSAATIKSASSLPALKPIGNGRT